MMVIDESHVSMPQVRAMFNGDRARKQNLVDFGFRLPSALDNRPLTFEEFDDRMGQRIYVSATPSPMPGVGTTSGAMQLTRIRRSPSSSARVRVRLATAAFIAA